MSRRDEAELITKAELSDDEQHYVDSRSHLATLREQYQAMPKESQESLQAQLEDEKSEAEAQEEENGVSVEEFVESATVAQIKAELDERGVEYDPKAKKPELGKLLVDAVHNEE